MKYQIIWPNVILLILTVLVWTLLLLATGIDVDTPGYYIVCALIGLLYGVAGLPLIEKVKVNKRDKS